MWCWIKSFYFSCKVEPTLGALIWKEKTFSVLTTEVCLLMDFLMSSVGWLCPFCSVFLSLLRDNSAIVQPKDCRTQITGSISKFRVFISDQFLQDSEQNVATLVHSVIEKWNTTFWNWPLPTYFCTFCCARNKWTSMILLKNRSMNIWAQQKKN